MSDGLQVVAVSLAEAEAFLKKHERHYVAPVEKICAVAVGVPNEVDVTRICDPHQVILCTNALHGAAILGRNKDGDAELAHIYVDGTSQGYSLLYGACWRVLKALGYKRTVL